MNHLCVLGHYPGFSGAWAKIQSSLSQGVPPLLPGDIQRQAQFLAYIDVPGVRSAGPPETWPSLLSPVP